MGVLTVPDVNRHRWARGWLVVALVAGLGAAGCYKTPEPACAFLCGEGDVCPDGYSCAADGWCKRDDAPADTTCDGTAQPADAAVDAPTVDAMPMIDADPAAPDAMIDATPPPDAMVDAAPPDAMVDAAPPDAMVDAPPAGWTLAP